jgi:hypothetical protein
MLQVIIKISAGYIVLKELDPYHLANVFDFSVLSNKLYNISSTLTRLAVALKIAIMTLGRFW